MSVVDEAARTIGARPDERYGPLPPLLLSLTVLTGVVDAASYLALGHVFVANMTGNVVFLGFAIAGARGLSVWLPIVAIAVFLLGALLGGRIGAGLAGHRGHLLRAATSCQAAAVTIALVVSLAVGEPPSSEARYALTGVLAFAMGVQNAAAQRLAIPELTTTVLTKTLTGIVSEARFVGGPGAHVGRRGLAVAAMLLGATAGGLLVLRVSIAATIGLALALVLSVALAAHALSRGEPAWARGD